MASESAETANLRLSNAHPVRHEQRGDGANRETADHVGQVMSRYDHARQRDQKRDEKEWCRDSPSGGNEKGNEECR